MSQKDQGIVINQALSFIEASDPKSSTGAMVATVPHVNHATKHFIMDESTQI
jgi:hypothetical protein